MVLIFIHFSKDKLSIGAKQLSNEGKIKKEKESVRIMNERVTNQQANRGASLIDKEITMKMDRILNKSG